jgi:hypothetical protein
MKHLLEPITDDRIRNANFGNGIVLSAELLRADQNANRDQHRQIGRGLGAGVVHGLEVTVTVSGSNTQTPVLQISPGLGFNALGEAVELRAAGGVQLVLEVLKPPPPNLVTGLFGDCGAVGEVALSAGVFVLVARPAAEYREKVTVVGIVPEGKAAGCTDRYSVEGLSFRLVPLSLPGNFLIQEPNTVRNRLAHRCLGTAEWLDADPLNPPSGYGLPKLLSGILTDCDLPLALLRWTGAGLIFCDPWAVRRRLQAPLAPLGWPLLGGRRLAEAEAAFLQFQDQLAAELAAGGLSTARGRFRYLPPAGLLPVGPGKLARNAVIGTFFQGLDVTEVELDPAFSRLMLNQSFYLEPIDLDDPPSLLLYVPPTPVDFLLYVRAEAVAAPAPSPTAPSPAPEPQPQPGAKKGELIVDLILTDGKIQNIPRDQIQITATLGIAKIPLVPVDDGKNQLGLGGFQSPEGVTFKNGHARFSAKNLKPETYHIAVEVLGYQKATRDTAIKADFKTQEIFHLAPERKRDGGKTTPPKIDIEEVPLGDWFDKAVVVEEWLDWPWPLDRWPEKPGLLPEPSPDPPPEVIRWGQDWAVEFGKNHPDAPIDPGDIRVYIDPAHTPDRIAETPYAYLVFGKGGAYVPLVLAPGGQGVGTGVPVGKAGLEWVDAGVETKLEQKGLADLSVLAYGWTGLLGEVLGLDAGTSRVLQTEARERANALGEQGTLLGLHGVDAALVSHLVALGVNNAVDLANQDPAALAQGLAEQGVQTSAGRVQLLVGQARGQVPASAWALGADGLGLSDGELAALAAQGIHTQGQFQVEAATAEGPGRLAGVLGADAAGVQALAAHSAHLVAAPRLAQQAKEPVTTLLGVSGGSAVALAGSGFATLGALASADPGSVASVFGGDLGRANAVIDAARGRLGLGPR